MNTSTFRDTLIDIAKGEGSNLTSKIIAFYYPSLDFSSRNNLFESLLNRIQLTEENHEFDFEKLMQDIPNDSEVFNIKDYENKDFRIKEIEISNLRGIPKVDEHNPIPYGINLIDDKSNIYNAIILANNGVGKSSVFAGLEMIYAQEVGEKKLRTLNPDNLKPEDFEVYLKNINNSEKPICKVKTIDGTFSLNKKIFENQEVLNHLNPQAHFISEYDIIRNGQSIFRGKGENTIHNIVADSLGLSEFLNSLQVSEQIPGYRRLKETSARNTIIKQIDENKKNIQNSEALIQSKRESLNELKKDDTSRINQDLSKEIGKLNGLLLKTSNLNLEDNNLVKYIEDYLSAFDSYSSIDINKKASIERDFLKAGTELLHDFDDCPYCENSKSTLEEIKTNVEKRLEELNNISNLNKQVSEKYKDATRELYETLQNYTNVYDLIQNDRSELSSFDDLIKIAEEEERLYLKLAPLINDDELLGYIQNLSQKNIPNDTNFVKFTELLNNNGNLFRSVLIGLNVEIPKVLKKRNKAIQNKIEKLSTNNISLPKEQIIDNLHKEIKELKEGIFIASSRIKKLEKELKRANKIVGFVDQLKTEIVSFNSKLRIEVDKLVEYSFQAFKEPIEEILNDYFIDDSNFELKLSLKEYPIEIDGEEYTSRNIVAEIKDKNNPEIKTSPDQYFNTFRFKLFSLMVSLSIALASRKKYRVNLPLVIDDLFYGSDYISKNTFAKFIQDLIILFYKHTPDIPLQIILFTHDNFIYKSALEGIDYLSIKNKGYNLEKTLKSRMFHPSDKEKEESNSGFKYWNLINS